MSDKTKSLLDILLEASPSSKIDAQVAQLEQEISREKDARRHERFIWLMAVLFLVSLMAFFHIPNIWVGFFIFILDLFCIIGFAKFCDIEEVSALLDKMFALLNKYMDSKIIQFQSDKLNEDNLKSH